MDYEKAERLAALLDGTCSAEEREELLALLAEDDDDLEVFAAAGAALSQHEQEERGAGVIRLRPAPAVPATAPAPRLRPPRRWLPLAAAAGIAAVLAIGLLRRGDGQASGVAQTVAMLSDSSLSLVDGIALAQEPLRGGASDGGSMRLGATLVDLEVAARSHDERQARQAAAGIAALLKRANASPDVTARYDSIGKAGVPADGLDPELAERAEQSARQANLVRVGEWLQAARIAAAHRDEDFFKTRQSQERLAGKGMALDGDSREILDQARAAAPAPENTGQKEPEWATLQSRLTWLLNGFSR
jgi:hypothetical protein